MAAAARLRNDVETAIRALGQMDWAIDKVIGLATPPERGKAAVEVPRPGMLSMLRQMAHDCSVVARAVARLADATGLPESRVRRLRALAEQLGDVEPPVAGHVPPPGPWSFPTPGREHVRRSRRPGPNLPKPRAAPKSREGKRGQGR